MAQSLGFIPLISHESFSSKNSDGEKAFCGSYNNFQGRPLYGEFNWDLCGALYWCANESGCNIFVSGWFTPF